MNKMRQFICLASYYRRFFEQFAKICKPLHNLAEKGVPFFWTEDCETAFEIIKILLTTAPVLSVPRTDGSQLLLDTDASHDAVGAILHQMQDGEEKVIGYCSKCLSKSKRKYCTTRKELVAVVKAVKNFHHFLCGQPFTIRTDHVSLQWLRNFRNHGEGQLARFLETLSGYSYKIIHRQGKIHSNRDSVSRRPCYDNNCQHCTRYEFRYSDEVVGTSKFVAQKPAGQKKNSFHPLHIKGLNVLS